MDKVLDWSKIIHHMADQVGISERVHYYVRREVVVQIEILAVVIRIHVKVVA